MLKRLRPFTQVLRRYRLQFGGLLALTFLTPFTEGAGIGLLFPLLAYLQNGDAFFTGNRWGRYALSALHGIGLSPSLGCLLTLIFAAIALSLGLRALLWDYSARISFRIARDVRDEAFSEILGAHIFRFYSGSSGELINTLDREAQDLGVALKSLAVGLSGGIAVMMYVALLLLITWKLTFVVAGFGLLRFAVSGLFLKRITELGEMRGSLMARFNTYLVGIQQGIDVVKSYGTESREKARYQRQTEDIRTLDSESASLHAKNGLAEGLVGNGLLCLLVYLAVVALHTPMVTLLAFLFLATRIVPKLTELNNSNVEAREYLARIRVLPQFFSEPRLPRLAWGTSRKEDLDDAIDFQSVSFTYPGSVTPSLSDVSFSLRKNSTLALVGESGSGKSTLARLLLRLFDPTGGTISIDGTPIHALRREDWIRLVGIVSQDTFVFDDTIEENVKYGVEACSREEFRRAIRLANAEEFIDRMPQKEKTRVGERGVRLSGGQRQRIAIARAFLRNPRILILDEATSAMDAATEKLIQDALDKLAEDRTMLIIAHRFTTIRQADEILVLEHGRIVERGRHAELVASGGAYKKYHDLQLR